MANVLKSSSIAVLLLISTFPCRADEVAPGYIEILGNRLNLGMPKSNAFALYAAYKVQCIETASLPPDCDSWIIQSNGPPYTAFANLQFTGGRLNSVRKYWDRGYQGTDPRLFVSTLYGILAQYSDTGPTSVQLETKETTENGVKQTAIFLSKGKRTAVISTIDGARNTDGTAVPFTVNAYEILQ